MLSQRAERALIKLGVNPPNEDWSWGVLQMRGVQLRGLWELRDAGLAEDDPTSKGKAKRWRLTPAGERLRAVTLEVAKKETIHAE